MAKTNDTRRHRAALPVFTPSAVSAESLVLRTVGREAEIERLVRAIRTAATTDNRPHQLIVGPRGSGKSHLLIVALHEALADEEIADQVVVAMLPEDAVEIAGYEDLLVSIIERAPGRVDDRREAARELRSRHDVAGLERAIVDQLGDRVLVLVVENLDRVFRDLGDTGQARLRNLIETSTKMLLLASTPLLFNAVSDHARPWYGSFGVEHLGELDPEQGRELLRRAAAAAGDEQLIASLGTSAGLSRVKAVAYLAGGSPRMWTVLAGCITIDLLDELVPLVEALFDELAPYYQQRLWELAGVERKLVYELCGVSSETVKNLAHATGISERAAATSLGRLHNAGWLSREKRPLVDKRATWYSLREPLLRHHVEYRDARDDRLPAIVGFLRNWYEALELAVHLATVQPASQAENYVVAALAGAEDPAWSGAWPALITPHDLVAAARCWTTERDNPGMASFVAAVTAEAVGIAVLQGTAAARAATDVRAGQAPAGRADALPGVIDIALAALEPIADDPVAACARGLSAASRADGLIEDRDRLVLGLLAYALRPETLIGLEWFETHETLAQALPNTDSRLRLIFEGCRALARLEADPERAHVDIRHTLLECSTLLGPEDWTTRVMAWNGVVATALNSRSEQLGPLAATIVSLMDAAQRHDELSMALMAATSAVAAKGDHEVRRGWLYVWADATRELAGFTSIHRFLAAVQANDPPDLQILPDEDLNYLRALAEALSYAASRQEQSLTSTAAR